jgi:invasion protein IalB
VIATASRLALFAAGVGAFLVVSGGVAFLIGHAVGTNDTLAANSAQFPRAQNNLSAVNTTRTAFENWSLVCRDFAPNERRCVLFMALVDRATTRVLLTISVAGTSEGTPVLVVDMPTDVAVDEGVTVRPGAADAARFAIRSCGPQRCRALGELNSSLRAALESADMTFVTYVTANHRPSTYNLPTRGFREGLVAWYSETGRRLPASVAVN